MISDHWASLASALNRWQQAGRVAPFWLRDDDAVEPTPALDRLLELAAIHDVPMTLAVIPEHTGEPLARLLEDYRQVNVSQHGWSHHNHAGAGEKKQELGAQRSPEVVLSELSEGFEKLSALYPVTFNKVLVPPWNRVAAPLLPELAGRGFAALSVFGAEKPSAISLVNTDADIMDWHGTRGCRPEADIVADIIRRLDVMWTGGGTMGLLTHHLVHDEAAWAFVDRLIAETKGHAGCRWRGLPELIPAG